MLDLIQSLFFESIILLICVELVVIAVVIARYRRWPTSQRRMTLWIVLAVCILLLIVQQVVETDRERIQFAVRGMASAVDAGDVPALGDYLDRDFRHRGLDKHAWLTDVRQRLQQWQIDEAKVGGFHIEINDDSAVTSFWASCHWRSQNQSEQNVYSVWKLGFIRREDGWKLQRVIEGKVGPGGIFDISSL